MIATGPGLIDWGNLYYNCINNGHFCESENIAKKVLTWFCTSERADQDHNQLIISSELYSKRFITQWLHINKVTLLCSVTLEVCFLQNTRQNKGGLIIMQHFYACVYPSQLTAYSEVCG